MSAMTSTPETTRIFELVPKFQDENSKNVKEKNLLKNQKHNAWSKTSSKQDFFFVTSTQGCIICEESHLSNWSHFWGWLLNRTNRRVYSSKIIQAEKAQNIIAWPTAFAAAVSRAVVNFVRRASSTSPERSKFNEAGWGSPKSTAQTIGEFSGKGGLLLKSGIPWYRRKMS